MRTTTLDLETLPFSRGNLAPRPVVASIAHADEEPYLARPRDVDWSFLDTDLVLTANGAYDFVVLLRHLPEIGPALRKALREHRCLDVLLADRASDIGEGLPLGKYSLASLTEKYLGRVLDKEHWRTEYAALEDVPLDLWPTGAVEYACTDTWATREVFRHVVARNSPNLGLLGHVTRESWALRECTVNGVPAHPERTPAFVEALNDYMEHAEKVLRRKKWVRTSGETDPVSGKKTPKGQDGTKNEKLVRTYMEKVYPQGAKGAKGASLNAQMCLESGSRLLQLFAEFGSANTLRERALRMLEGVGSTLHPDYWCLKESYRTSATQGEFGFQVQNVTKAKELGKNKEKFELRSIPTPGPGEKFVQADWTAAELVSLAQLCKTLFGFSSMGELLVQGVDLYSYFSARNIGVSDTDFQKLPKKEKKTLRQQGKAFVLGAPGGLGVAKMQASAKTTYKVDLTEDQVRFGFKTYFAMFPEIRLYLDWVNKRCESSSTRVWSEKLNKSVGVFEYVHPLTGFVRGRVGYSDGANHGFQHITAYIMGTAIANIVDETYEPSSPLYGTKMWGVVHDEGLGRSPEERAPEAADRMSQIMCAAYLEICPDFPITAPPCVSSVWSKDMTSERDENGRLLEWVP